MRIEEAREAIKEAYGNSEYTDEIIKALEQWSILDKIRAEIERKANSCNIIMGEDEDNWRWGQYNAYTYVLSIIDKYMKEKVG